MSVTLALLLGAALASAAPAQPDRNPAQHLEPAWRQWVSRHRPEGYPTAEAERRAFANFVANDERIAAHNRQAGVTYTVGHTLFSDLSPEQFRQRMRARAMPRAAASTQPLAGPIEVSKGAAAAAPPPKELDWSKLGKVTPVMNEGQCGATWAMSAVGAIESSLAIATDTDAVPLSVAQVMDCDNKTDHGCNGGLMTTAFHWVAKHPLCKAADYPYEPRNGQCNATCTPYAGITGYTAVVASESALLEAVVKQPVSVAVDASNPVWQMYKGGVIDAPKCLTELDHALLLVGYGVDPKAGPYWKVRNQWGEEWGEEGYARIARGHDECGIANEAAYPNGAHRVKGLHE